MSKHTETQYLEVIGPNHSTEIEVEITFNFIKGYPETGPTYSCGGEPAEPDSIEVLSFVAYEIVGDKRTKIEMCAWLEGLIERAIDEDELLANVDEYEGA